MKKTKVLLLTVLFGMEIMSFGINNSNQNIKGTICDAVTGYPLVGATVLVLNTNPLIGTAADSNGIFILKEVPLGRQDIQISYLGYKTQTINNLLVIVGKEISVEVKLEEEITQVDEVVVKAESSKDKALNDMAPVSARTFSIEETERFAGSLGDPARMVSNYAGVATNSDTRNDIVIRGNSPSGVLWRLEGIEIPNPNHFGALGTTGGPVSMINNNLLTNSDFLTGAFPAEFGNAIAGAFDLNMRSGNSDHHEFVGQIGFNGFELGAEGPMFTTGKGQKASYLGSFRYSTMEVMKQLGFSPGTGSAVPDYKDFTYMIDIPGTKLGRFKIFGLWGDSFIGLGRDYDDTTESSYNGKGQAIDFGSGLTMIGISNTYFFNEKTRLTSSLSWQSTKSISNVDSVFDLGAFIKPYFRSKLVESKLSYSSKLRYKQNAQNNFSFGVIIDAYNINYIDSVDDPDYGRFITVADIDGDMILAQAYGQWQHKFMNNLSTFIGIHSQYFNLNDQIVIEPRLGFEYQLNERNTLNAGFGMHSQLQPKVVYFTKTVDQDTYASWETNHNVKFTRSNHYVIGYNRLINKDFRLKTEVYYQQLYDVPVQAGFPEFSMLNAGADFGVPLIDSLVNEGTGRNYGLELTFEKFLSKGYYFLLTASLFDSKYKGYDKIERNTAFNGNYITNLLGGYEYKINDKFMLTFDVRSTLAGGHRYVPVDIEKSKYEGSTEYDYSKAYEKKYGDYFRTDLRIGFKHNWKSITQEWGIDLQNITNYQSIFMEYYDNNANKMEYTYQQGFMPMFLYRIVF
jgi:hypothetical protein